MVAKPRDSDFTPRSRSHELLMRQHPSTSAGHTTQRGAVNGDAKTATRPQRRSTSAPAVAAMARPAIGKSNLLAADKPQQQADRGLRKLSPFSRPTGILRRSYSAARAGTRVGVSTTASSVSVAGLSAAEDHCGGCWKDKWRLGRWRCDRKVEL